MNCNVHGLGYDLLADQTTEAEDMIAKRLIKSGYARRQSEVEVEVINPAEVENYQAKTGRVVSKVDVAGRPAPKRKAPKRKAKK